MYIGIDLGTSGVKLILTDTKGKIVHSITKEYPLYLDENSWSEQDPNDWFKQTVVGLKELITGYEDQVKGIGFSGQMHGLVILDEKDNILRNAILWNDQRTVNEVQYLNNEIGINTLQSFTGNIALTGLTAPKLLWVKNNEPELFAKINKIMLPKDYLIYKFTGTFFTDVADASGTLYFDCEKRKYSQEMLDIIGIKEDMLPLVLESYEIGGYLSDTYKEYLGIVQEVSVVPGGGDQAVGAVGVGIVTNNEASISLGTSGVIFVATDDHKVDTKSHLQSYAHANGQYHIMAVMLSAAGSLKWWHEEILGNTNYTNFDDKLFALKPTKHLQFLPYLTGERAPINDPNAKGVFFGIQRSHTNDDFTKAVIEGVTFALKDSFVLLQELGINVSNIRVTGGGAKSAYWNQTLSNVLNCTVQTIKQEEGPALGAAILAMVGNKEFTSVKEACDRIIKLEEVYQPQNEMVAFYNDKYLRFTKIYPAIKELF